MIFFPIKNSRYGREWIEPHQVQMIAKIKKPEAHFIINNIFDRK